MFLQRWLRPDAPAGLVGLDIDSRVIKLIKVTSNKYVYTLDKYALTPLPREAIIKNEFKDPDTISQVLKETFKEAGLSNADVAVAIPRSLAIIKNVTVDSRLNQNEIESRAWIEAERSFPDLVGDIYLDFNILGPSAQDPTQLELILVACRKEQINLYLDLLKSCNLTPKIVDVNCYALERALGTIIENTSTNPEEAVALLNLNFSLSSLIVTQKNQLIYAHDHSYEGENLMTKVRNYLQISGDLITPVNFKDTINDEAYNELIRESLSSHLRHTMHFFYSSRPNVRISKLFLAGDCAHIPNLTSYIQKEINANTFLANPFANMKIASHVDVRELQTYAPSLTLCYGLAISNID